MRSETPIPTAGTEAVGATRTQADAVVSRAVLQAATRLGMNQRELAAVLGCSEATVSRIARGGATLELDSKPGELAVLLLRLYRSLDAMVGGDDGAGALWFAAENTALGAAPAELVRRVDGLVRTVEYLDAMRGAH